MTDDLYYKPGSNYVICDRTGFKVRVERSQREWDGLQVRRRSWERRQPQDLVRGVMDDQSVAIARPQSPDVFMWVETKLAARAAPTDGTIDVERSLGIAMNDVVSIMLDSGELFRTTVSGIANNTLTLADPIPGPGAALGAVVIDDTAAQRLAQQPQNYPVVNQ